MNIFKQIAFGFQLTKLTNIFLQIERIKKFNGMLFEEGELSHEAELEIEKLVQEVIKISEKTKKADPYIVTRELIKNMRLAEATNQLERLTAQNSLYKFLCRDGICMFPEEFMTSYYMKNFK